MLAAIPESEQESKSGSSNSEAEEDTIPNMDKIEVLFAEHEPASAQCIQNRLQNSDFADKYHMSTDGQDLLNTYIRICKHAKDRAVREQSALLHIKLIFLDPQMPRLQGNQVYVQICSFLEKEN